LRLRYCVIFLIDVLEVFFLS